MGEPIYHDGCKIEDLMQPEPERYEAIFNEIRDRVDAEIEAKRRSGEKGPFEVRFRSEDNPIAVTDLINGAMVMGWKVRQERRPEGLSYFFDSPHIAPDKAP